MTLTPRQIETRQAIEFSITPEQLLKEMLDSGRIKVPARRYRVEGSAAANSILLDVDVAKVTHARYGGVLRELVTAEVFYRAQAARAFRLTPCAVCGAKAGEPCTEGTVIRHAHNARLGKPGTVSEQLAIGLPECPVCHAAPSAPCHTDKRTNDGAWGQRLPHQERKPQQVRPTAPVAELAECLTCGAAATAPCKGPSGRVVKPHKGRLTLALAAAVAGGG